jgi:ribonuclease Z
LQIGARKLLLNHFSPRYHGDGSTDSVMVMTQIEKLARKAMGSKEENSVIAAWDLLRVPIPINKPAKSEATPNEDEPKTEAASSS